MLKLLEEFINFVCLICSITISIFLTYALCFGVFTQPREWEKEHILKERLIYYKDQTYVVDKLRMVDGCTNMRCHNE